MFLSPEQKDVHLAPPLQGHTTFPTTYRSPVPILSVHPLWPRVCGAWCAAPTIVAMTRWAIGVYVKVLHCFKNFLTSPCQLVLKLVGAGLDVVPSACATRKVCIWCRLVSRSPLITKKLRSWSSVHPQGTCVLSVLPADKCVSELPTISLSPQHRSQ